MTKVLIVVVAVMSLLLVLFHTAMVLFASMVATGIVVSEKLPNDGILYILLLFSVSSAFTFGAWPILYINQRS